MSGQTRGLLIVVVVAGATTLFSRTAFAQIELSGNWNPLLSEDQQERVPGPAIGDYLGLPITDAARMKADAWDAEVLTLPERQCIPHPSTYGFRGIGLLHIWTDVDDATQQLIKINTQIQWMEQKREIWMDGRPHPPEYAAHTWQGFSTGRWEGDTLVVTTTHLKAGWTRRNGLPLSDRATMEDRFIRHGDLLTHVSIVQDPYYLTEPLIKTNGFRLDLNARMQPYPCESVTEVVRARGEVPHHLPGQNPFLHEFADKHHLPYAATRGGAETADPNYLRTLPAVESR
jgi:hypothetical protein